MGGLFVAVAVVPGRNVIGIDASFTPAQTRALRDPQLLAEVEQGVTHAAGYGITAEADLRVFLECRLELGADFDVRA